MTRRIISTVTFLIVTLLFFTVSSVTAQQRHPPCYICDDDPTATITYPHRSVALPLAVAELLGVDTMLCSDLFAEGVVGSLPIEHCRSIRDSNLWRDVCGCSYDDAELKEVYTHTVQRRLQGEGTSPSPSTAPTTLATPIPSALPTDLATLLPSISPTIPDTSASPTIGIVSSGVPTSVPTSVPITVSNMPTRSPARKLPKSRGPIVSVTASPAAVAIPDPTNPPVSLPTNPPNDIIPDPTLVPVNLPGNMELPITMPIIVTGAEDGNSDVPVVSVEPPVAPVVVPIPPTAPITNAPNSPISPPTDAPVTSTPISSTPVSTAPTYNACQGMKSKKGMGGKGGKSKKGKGGKVKGDIECKSMKKGKMSEKKSKHPKSAKKGKGTKKRSL